MPHLNVRLVNPSPIPLNTEFDCAAGELVALVGPSGSGKTSLLRAVAGLLHGPGLRGSVHVGNSTWFDSVSSINLAPQARRVGMVFQSYALFPHLSAISNVAISADRSFAKSQKQAYAQALFERLGLEGLQQRLPAQLSGGQQQRVALARALMRLHNPVAVASPSGVLLLDEPFSAVDAPTRQTLYRELAELRTHVSVPMVLVTHDLQEARRLADRVVILDGGTTLQSGTPAAVFSRPRNARVAQLVGIQNLFHGTFHRGTSGMAILRWVGENSHAPALDLAVHDKGRIVDGAHVRWVLAGESLELVAKEPGAACQSVPNSPKPVWCDWSEVLELGETSLCTLVPLKLPSVRLTLTLASSQVRMLHSVAGSKVGVCIAPHAIHIMPVRA
jgi:molybdate transport system ATP-binding protein